MHKQTFPWLKHILNYISSFRKTGFNNSSVANSKGQLCWMQGEKPPKESLMPRCFTPSQLLSGTGVGGTASLAGSQVSGRSVRTPDPPATLLPTPHAGDPRHRTKRVLGGHTCNGKLRAVPVPKGQQNGTGEQPLGKEPSALLPSSFPTWGHFSGHSCPSSQNSHIWLHASPSQQPPDARLYK